MSDLTLYVGNKNYSSWSFRPWIAMEAAGVPFKDVVIPFDFAAGNPEFRKISPTGRVPVLHHGEVRERGTHAQLRARQGLYERLYRLQAGERETPSAGSAALASLPGVQ